MLLRADDLNNNTCSPSLVVVTKPLDSGMLRPASVIKTSEAHKSGVGSICFSPNGGFALSGGWDNTIKLWIFDWEWDF